MADGDLRIGGYVIGRDQPVFATEIDPGYPEIRTQDAESPNGDDRFFGRDYLTPPVWSMTFVTDAADAAGGLTALGELARIWRSKELRQNPNKVLTLEYEIAGRPRLVYGRPRKFAYNPTNPADGVISATAEFATADALFYAAEEQRRRVTLVPASTGGFTTPFESPIIMGGSAEIQGLIEDVGGDEPAPFRALIHGPVSNPYLYGDGWEIRLAVTLAYDTSLTIDTRTFEVIRSDGTSLAGYLARGTRLADARLQPGPDRIVFGGSDTTGTAYAEVSWHAAFNGF